MFKKIMILAVAATTLLAFSLPTMSRDFADIYTDCGLGAMIAPRNAAVAAVTNVTWDLGTTAISTNISSPDSCAGGKEKTAAFIHESYASIEKDLAGGDGVYLEAMTTLAGCDSKVSKELTSALRDDFTKIVANPGYTEQSSFEQASTLYELLYKHVDGEFSKSCS